MKHLKLFLLLGLALWCPAIGAQQVTWSVSALQGEEPGLWDVTVSARIAGGWHIYDLVMEEGGPNPTVLSFTLPEGASLVGDMVPSVPSHKYQDMLFGMEVGYWEGDVSFTQKVRCDAPGGVVKVRVEWMACDDMNCIPPDEVEMEVELSPSVLPAAQAGMTAPAEETGKGVLWAMILEAVLWGLAALLTPCVFPIVPMTVSFFLKGEYSASRNRFRAFMYGVFIVGLYTVPVAAVILVTRAVGGDAVTADIFNWLSTHWIPNVLFFLVFMAFAASFFGAFEIVLPSSLMNGSDVRVDRNKGLGGVFFLALTLVLVSFSCTGPIVGTVLIKSVSGEFWVPIVTMLAFSVAFSLPFVLFALFPGMMKRLPGSGGWLNTVKVVLGFVEIALGFKFLSTADQVYHWGILDREVYLAVWIVVFSLLGFYLLGKLKFRYDSEVKYIGVGRLALAIIDFAFVVYMVPGMWGAPLKALSGYLPPMETQDFITGRYAPASDGTCADGFRDAGVPDAVTAAAEDMKEPGKGKYSDVLELPLGLKGFFDLEEAKAYAALTGKSIFIDFTGHGCVNCREMESRVWSDPEVLRRLSGDFVICALYTDDKLQVAPDEWVTIPGGKVLKTLGKINAHYAQSRFSVAAQPFYVIMSPDGEVLRTRGYDLDVEDFIRWLDL